MNEELITVFFNSVNLNKNKYELLLNYAKLNRYLRNELSDYFWNIHRYDMYFNRITKNHFINISSKIDGIISILKGNIGSQNFQQSAIQVYSNYLTIFSNRKFYYREGKIFNKSNFVKTVEFLIRNYEFDNSKYNLNKVLNLINSNLKIQLKSRNIYDIYKQFIKNNLIIRDKISLEIDKLNYQRNNIINSMMLIEKFGNRFLNLIKNMQIKFLNKTPKINYKSLTFHGVNLLGNRQMMIEENDNLKIANAVIKLKLPNINYKDFDLKSKDKQINILTRYKESYHGKLKDFNYSFTGSNQSQLCYTLYFYENKRKIKLILTKSAKVSRKEILSSIEHTLDNNVTEGIDVNSKRNIFSLSDGKFITFDKQLLRRAYRLMKDLQLIQFNSKKNNNPLVHSNKIRRRENKLRRQSEEHIIRKTLELKKYLEFKGIKHVVIEDLDLRIKSFAKDKITGLKYSSIANVLHLTDAKNIIRRLLEKAGIMVSLVNPRYTSQTCSRCGYIDRGNRPNQEHFHCKHCGYEEDADINSAINIKNRILIPILREKLEFYNESDKCYKGRNYIYKNIYQGIYNLAYK